jgi:diguanylate cyclase (GGDEF)-like protein
MEKSLIEQLKIADRLPSAPGVAMEVVRMNQRDDVSMDELAQVLSRDPALVAKVLKTANSSMFGLPREITNVRQAIMILGFRSVNLLALSFSLVSASRGQTSIPFNYRRYWTHTIATTVASRFIADLYAPGLKDEAFVAGLLCDLGQPILAESAPKEYAPVLARMSSSGGVLQDVEQEILGTTHAEVARELLDAWGLPVLLCDAIGAHHDPPQLSDSTARTLQLAQVLQLSTTCSDLLVSSDTALEEAVEELASVGSRYFSMDGVACAELLKAVEPQLEQTANLLEVDMEDPSALLEVRTRASELLVRETLALNQQVQSVSNEVERLSHQKAELEVQATTDTLTGLKNRGFFDEMLQGEIDRAGQHGHSLGLLMLDLDHFKSVNDNYGHPVGDELLRRIAAVVQEHVGDMYSPARYGGEEITVICPGLSLEELRDRAEKLRAAIAAIEFPVESGAYHPTVSIGGCLLQGPAGEQAATEMVAMADQQLYRAKSEGRNRVCVVAPDDEA